MKKRYLSLFLLALASICLLCACDNGGGVTEVPRTPLDAPTGLTVNGTELNWSPVENAVSYDVEYFYAEVDDATILSGSTQTTSYALDVDRPGQWVARVRARADENSFYGRSVWTDWFDFRPTTSFALTSPDGFEAKAKTVSWSAIPNAIKYAVEINGENLFATEETSYTFRSPVPGETYSIRVKALGDDYYSDSAWSTAFTFVYEPTFAAPTVYYDGVAAIRWDACDDLCDGYYVTVKDLFDGTVTESKVDEEKYDLSTLEAGSYQITVRVSGGKPEYDSPASNALNIRLTALADWDAYALASDFSPWNYCTATATSDNGDAYASLRCREGWGGIILKDALTVNYDRNPVLAIYYGDVPYGYMGNYYFGDTLYVYAPDVNGGTANFTACFDMAKSENNQSAIEEAVGIRTDVRISVGFTFAPTGADDREVMQIKRARIVYIEELPPIPDEPEKLTAPTDTTFDGLTLSWNYQSVSALEPSFDIEVYCNDELIEAVENHKFTTFDLSSITGGVGYGKTYYIRVKQLGDGLYYEDSDYAVSASVTVETQKAPTGLKFDFDGYAYWDEAEYTYYGYTVCAEKDGVSTEYVVTAECFNIAWLDGGDYKLKVKVNGSSPEYDSEYSDYITFRVTEVKVWDAQALASDFSSWNYCTATATSDNGDAYASLRCREGWGGIMLKDALTLNFDRNPVFTVDYRSVSFGYMGNFYFGDTLYVYAADVKGAFTDLINNYMMTGYVDGAISEAVGVRNDVKISIGFTHAPAGTDDREVMQVRCARLVYIEDIPVVPEVASPLTAPGITKFEGSHVYWLSAKGNGEYTPVYTLEISYDDGNSVEVVKTVTDYPYTTYDLDALGDSFKNGKYVFKVKAQGDGIYFADSVWSAAVTANYTITVIDLSEFVDDAVAGGGENIPQAGLDNGKLVLTQSTKWGMLRYNLPDTINVENTWLYVDIESITGGYYYMRMPLTSTGNANSSQCIVSHDSNITGTFCKKLTDIEALQGLSGPQSLSLHIGLSGTNVTCVINSIRLITVTRENEQ